MTTGIGSSTGGGQRSSLPTAFTGKPKERSKWDGVWLQARECVKSLPDCRCHRLMRVCRWETEEQRLHRTGIAHGGSVGGAPSSPASRQHPGDPRLPQEKDAEDDYAYWQTLPDVDDQASDARQTWLELEEDTDHEGDSQNRPYHYESRANLITHVDVFATRSAETDLVLAEERKYRDVLSNMDLLFR